MAGLVARSWPHLRRSLTVSWGRGLEAFEAELLDLQHRLAGELRRRQGALARSPDAAWGEAWKRGDTQVQILPRELIAYGLLGEVWTIVLL